MRLGVFLVGNFFGFGFVFDFREVRYRVFYCDCAEWRRFYFGDVGYKLKERID